jgi:hypothetical protein
VTLSGLPPLPVPEAELLHLAQLATDRKVTKVERNSAYRALRDLQAMLLRVLRKVAEISDDERSHVVLFRHESLTTYLARGSRICIERSWRDEIAVATLRLCERVGFSRIGACLECGAVFVSAKDVAQRWCGQRCGSRFRKRDMKMLGRLEERLDNS